MAYPVNPTNGQIYGNKKYDSAKGAWIEYVAQVPSSTNAINTSGGIITGTNVRVPTSQPTTLVNGDIWVV